MATTKGEKVARINQAIEALYDAADCGLTETQRSVVLEAVFLCRMIRSGVEAAGPRLVPRAVRS